MIKGEPRVIIEGQVRHKRGYVVGLYVLQQSPYHALWLITPTGNVIYQQPVYANYNIHLPLPELTQNGNIAFWPITQIDPIGWLQPGISVEILDYVLRHISGQYYAVWYYIRY